MDELIQNQSKIFILIVENTEKTDQINNCGNSLETVSLNIIVFVMLAKGPYLQKF